MVISTDLIAKAKSGDVAAAKEVFELVVKEIDFAQSSSASVNENDFEQKVLFPLMAAASGGHAEAQLGVAELLMQGSDASDPEVYNQAIEWLRLATEKGNVTAAVKLSNLLAFKTPPDAEGALWCALKIAKVASANEKTQAIQNYHVLVQFAKSENYAQADLFQLCVKIVNEGEVAYQDALKSFQEAPPKEAFNPVITAADKNFNIGKFFNFFFGGRSEAVKEFVAIGKERRKEGIEKESSTFWKLVYFLILPRNILITLAILSIIIGVPEAILAWFILFLIYAPIYRACEGLFGKWFGR